MTTIPHRLVLGMRVDATSYRDATAAILEWADTSQSRYICVANVHMVMEAFDNEEFRRVVNGADLVTPDGMPIVWGLRLMGVGGQQRVYGPELTMSICLAAADAGVPVGFYGGTPESLGDLKQVLYARFPTLRIPCMISPPFRPLTIQEDSAYTEEIRASGVRILFVGVGCPKQEWWMAAHKVRIPAVMVGVGAAFDFHSGSVKQAPAVMQRLGLEWLFRLLIEPRRLWRRYAKHNPRFVLLFLMQLLRGRQT